MKIAIITDTHAGHRNDNIHLNEYFLSFYKDLFFPYLESNPDIKHVIHLGDVFDRRKYINFNTLASWRKHVFDRLHNLGLEVHIILGNHDTFYRNTNAVNSVEEIFDRRYNWHVYSKPSTINIGDFRVCLLPWINDENVVETFEEVSKTDAQICMAHLELNGFQVSPGHLHIGGLDHKLFNKFDMVFTGHFHQKQSQDNIHYLGSPYPMNWGDWGDRRGFHVFDTDTRELEFIENPLQIFTKIYYNDVNENFESIMSKDFSQYKGHFVRVIVQKKTNPYWLDQFIEALQKADPCDISIIEGSFENGNEMDEESLDETKDTLSILMEYVDDLEADAYKSELKQVLSDLYIEALNTNDQIQSS